MNASNPLAFLLGRDLRRPIPDVPKITINSAQLTPLVSSNLLVTVQRRHLWVVTLSKRYHATFATSGSI